MGKNSGKCLIQQMAEEGKSPSLLAPVGLVWVISLLVGLPFGAAHKTVAPAPAKGDHNTESSVPAGNKAYCRLWEDPLEAAGALSYQKTAKDNFEKGQDSNSASFSGVARTLFILARGSRYADMGEWRRQQRYAVQAALWNKGYAPVHAEYLGYHDIPLSQVVSSRERPSTVEDDAYFRVPFELFRKEKSTDRLAVCYINLALLEESHALRSLYLIAKGMGLEKTQLDVSTPPSTDLLNSMLAEGESRNPAKNADFETMLHSLPVEKPAEMQIFNTLATGELKGFNTTGGDTVPHAHIDLKAGPSNYLNATVYNLIESDAQTAQRIVGELELRHENLDGPGWMRGQCIVAVVSEWETQFGREFAGRMRAAGNGQKELGSARIGQMNVEAYDYLRGLNGLAPDGRTSSPVPELPSPTQRAEDAHTPGEALSRTIEPPPLPAPFGTSQFDYIARLGEELLHKNAEKKSSGQGEFRAFCLIGTDVDDKLALLKVLRPRFPDALFFTNDMSAEYLQPENNAIARNLIVETCYGLDDTLGDKKKDGMQSRSRIALSNDGQKNAKLPRFRTSTQVAIVDSIEAALSEASLDERLVKPVQLFEVGLRRWHPLDPITQQAQAKENERQGTESSSAKQPGGAKPKSGDSVKHLEWAGSLPTGAWLFFWLALIGVLWHFLLSISERGKWEKRPGIVGALLKC